MEKEGLQQKILKELYEWVSVGLGALIITVLIFTFVFRAVGVIGDSMEPTLHKDDRLILWQIGYTPKRGDIVVVTKPIQGKSNTPLIKRVIALGGEEVDIDYVTGAVTITHKDGKKEVLYEPYIKEPIDKRHEVEFPQIIPDGCVFVMGDNRNNSLDSRAKSPGMIEEHYVLGKAIFRIYPFKLIGKVS